MLTLRYIGLSIILHLLFISTSFAQQGIINTSKAKLRACDDIQCRTLTTLNKGAVCQILGGGKLETLDSYGNHPWIRVRFNNYEGFVFGGLIDLQDNPTEEISIDETAYIREDNVNVRACGGGFQDCQVIFKLTKGKYCRLLSKTKKETTVTGMGTHPWYLIEAGQKRGYVFGGLLAIESDQITVDSQKVQVYDIPDMLNGQVIDFVVKRDKYRIEEQSAKSEVIRPYGRNYWYRLDKNGTSIGWIYGAFTSKATADTDCQCVDYVKNSLGITGPTKHATDWEEVLYGKIKVTLNGITDSLDYEEIVELEKIRKDDIAIFDKQHGEVDPNYGHIATVYQIAKVNGEIGDELIVEGGNHDVALANFYNKNKCNNVSQKRYTLNEYVRFFRPKK